MTKQKTGEQFLHERDPRFHASLGVETVVDYLRAKGEDIPNDPARKIGAYLHFLAAYVDDGILTGDQHSIDRQIELASISLSKENADAYVKFQTKVAREQGRGAEINHDTLDDRHKMDALRVVRKDQQDQLAGWIGELVSEENRYPDWFKYWIFENVKRLTAFNDDLGSNGRPKGFEKRSKSSFALFPELDRESLSLVHDALVEKLGGDPMGFEYDNMRTLLTKANFAELYAEAQNYGFKITNRLKQELTGAWHDFQQSDHEKDSESLSGLVRSYRTGWCTAGKETAKIQLQAGDFYVWCSRNPDTGRNEVPRIAVRMEGGSVAQVRGIVGGRRQELEPELLEVVMEKVKDLPGGESYFKKAEDMKRVTSIDAIVKDNPNTELSTADIRFLYELDAPIQGFGYDRDPRIDEIKKSRGERDIAELARLLQEVILDQAYGAYSAYRDTAVKLGAREVMTEAAFAGLLEHKEDEWQKNGVMDYLVKELIEKGSKPNLVATPNIIADWQQLKRVAVEFGQGQPYETHVYDELYKQYTPEQLSGVLTDGLVRLCIIPSQYNVRSDTVADQRQQLAELQSQQPELSLRVPSVLDSLMLWQSLRVRGNKLDSYEFNLTYIRHFDLPEKWIDHWLFVPNSYVDNGGRPRLNSSNADYDDDGARLVVG